MRGKLSPETLEDLAALTASIQAHPTTLHARVADADRTRAIEPPTYRPGNPMWEAGYASARAQAAALAATAGCPHMRILAMRPTAPGAEVVVRDPTRPSLPHDIAALCRIGHRRAASEELAAQRRIPVADALVVVDAWRAAWGY